MSHAGYSGGGAGKEKVGQINTSKPFSSHPCRLIDDLDHDHDHEWWCCWCCWWISTRQRLSPPMPTHSNFDDQWEGLNPWTKVNNNNNNNNNSAMPPLFMILIGTLVPWSAGRWLHLSCHWRARGLSSSLLLCSTFWGVQGLCAWVRRISFSQICSTFWGWCWGNGLKQFLQANLNRYDVSADICHRQELYKGPQPEKNQWSPCWRKVNEEHFKCSTSTFVQVGPRCYPWSHWLSHWSPGWKRW